MNIVYISGMCSEKKFKKLYRQGIIQKLPQAQKYHRLLVEGIKINTKDDVLVISSYPVNRRWTKKIIFKKEEEKINNISYKYPFFLNMPIFRQLCLMIFSFFYTFLFLIRNKDSVVICDILTKSNSAGARIACKIFKKKCIGIVTDVPGKTSGSRRKTLSKSHQFFLKVLEKITSKNLDKFDSYLFLTEAMNKEINSNEKPYIVLEGHSDINMNNKDNKIELKNKKKTMLYSGGIHKEFGVKRLVEAFISLKNAEWELHIYGDGNYEKEIEKICLKNQNIKYFGVVDNEIVVDKQIRAHILINPRLTNAEYIKYSFPSKNLEYMASGTPMLTTVLPGMPKEYFDYVYLIEDESLDGFKRILNKVMKISKYELHLKGKEAKKFVMTYKNNTAQAKKLLDFLEE